MVLGLSLPSVVHPWVLPLAERRATASRCGAGLPPCQVAREVQCLRGEHSKSLVTRVGLKFSRGCGQLLVAWRDVMWHGVGGGQVLAVLVCSTEVVCGRACPLLLTHGCFGQDVSARSPVCGV